MREGDFCGRLKCRNIASSSSAVLQSSQRNFEVRFRSLPDLNFDDREIHLPGNSASASVPENGTVRSASPCSRRSTEDRSEVPGCRSRTSIHLDLLDGDGPKRTPQFDNIPHAEFLQVFTQKRVRPNVRDEEGRRRRSKAGPTP